MYIYRVRKLDLQAHREIGRMIEKEEAGSVHVTVAVHAFACS